MKLDVSQLNPCVLRASFFDGYLIYSRSGKYLERVVYDYELEYYVRSEGGIYIDGEFVPFAAGDVNIRKPGQRVQGSPPYRCYIICFNARGMAERRSDYAFGTPQDAQPNYENAILDALPRKLSPSAGSGMGKLFEQVYYLESSLRPENKWKSRVLLMEIIKNLYDMSVPDMNLLSADVRNIIKEIEEHFTENISINAMIGKSSLSSATFHRHFLKETGMTPLGMVTSLRLNHAKELLLFTDYPVAEVAYMCGYEDNAYFSRIFKRACGITPLTFRTRRGH